MLRLGVGVVVSLLLLPVESVRAATLAVPGSFSTIQAAINAASNGDVISVSPGTYTQNLDYQGKGIAIRSVSGPAVTTIHVSGGTAVSMGNNSELTGFTVSGANAAFGAGVAIVGTGQLIKGNIFANNTQSAGGYGAAIGGNNASPTIEKNIFRNNSADGQFLSGVVSFVNDSSPLIENNLFTNNSARAINFTTPVDNSPVVINNTIVGNTVGVREDNRVPASTTIFRNNIIANNGIGLEDDFGNASTAPTWENNLLFNNTTEYSGLPDLTGTLGNLLTNPKFVSATDFHLMFNSPAIDAGSVLLAPSDDLDNAARPVNSIDIGAYQFVPEPSSIAVLAVMLGWMSRRRQRHS